MACVAKRRGKWVLDYRDRQGHRHWESYKTQKEAKAARSEREREIGRGTYIPPDQEKTFDALCTAFTTAHQPTVKRTTWTDYESGMRLHLIPYFSGLKLREINVTTVEEFVKDCVKQDVGTRTINKSLVLLGALFTYADKHEWMHSNPAKHAKKLKTSDTDSRDDQDEAIFTPAEFQKVLDHAAPKWRLLVMMAGLTGLRQGELLGLQWKNVDLNVGEVRVRRQYTAGAFSTLKSKSARRTVPLAPDLVHELRKHKMASKWKAEDDLVFPTSTGNPQSASNLITRGWHPTLRRAKVRARTFHSLRHTFASMLIDNDVNMKIIQKLCGHSSIMVTMDTYGHLLKDATDGVAEKLAEKMLGARGSKMVAKSPL